MGAQLGGGTAVGTNTALSATKEGNPKCLYNSITSLQPERKPCASGERFCLFVRDLQHAEPATNPKPAFHHQEQGPAAPHVPPDKPELPAAPGTARHRLQHKAGAPSPMGRGRGQGSGGSCSPRSAAERTALPSRSVCPEASNTLCLSILPQFITKFLKHYIFYYIQIRFIAFDNTDNHIPYALMF